MSKRALIALLAGGAGLTAADAASARSRTEDEGAYRQRTGRERIDYGDSEGFREEMRSVARGVRATATLEPNASPRIKALAGDPGLRNIARGQAATMAEYRDVLDAYEDVNPEAARALKAQLARYEPARDRDVDETGLGAFGAGAAGVAALALTRGRTASVRRAVLKALKGGAIGGAGGAAGAAFANADQAVLSGDDMPDVGRWAAGGAALGAAAVGGRSGLIRAVRAAAVRRQRLAQMRPAASGPVFDARAADRVGARRARNTAPVIERDSDMLAADVLHMERTLDAAGMPRVLTSADDVKSVARQIRREADFPAMQEALDTLEGRYRQALKKLKVGQERAPSLRHIDPYVTDPADRAAVEEGVRGAVRRTQRRRRAQRKRRAAEREMRT